MQVVNHHPNPKELALGAGGSSANNDLPHMVLIRECILAHVRDPVSHMRGWEELRMALVHAAQPRMQLYMPHSATRWHAPKVDERGHVRGTPPSRTQRHPV